jgi:hypothetical protein
MTLSAMQDVSNSVYDYYGQADKNKWNTADREGLTAGTVTDLLGQFSGAVDTTTYSCQVWGVESQTKKVNKLMTDHPGDVAVVIFLSSKIMQDENAKGGTDHFVRLLAPVRWSDTSVEADIFTWGGKRTVKMSPKNYSRMVGAYSVGAYKKGIL